MSNSLAHPENLMIKTVAMPEHTNYRGDVFGGWLLAQMDLAAGLCGAHVAQGHVATVAVKHVHFKHPVFVGDTVCVYAHAHHIGRTSLTIDVEVHTIRRGETTSSKTHDAQFVIVAIDEQRRPRPVFTNDSSFNN